jgi:hypothetical protein
MINFTSNIQEILTIMTDPSSYVKTTPNTITSQSFGTIMTEIIKNCNHQKLTNQKIEEKDITSIIEMIQQIIPSDELKIDYSDLFDYFQKVETFQENPICNCYVRDHDKLEEYTDDDVIKSYDLFMAFHCKTCGHFDSAHKSCTKYIHTNDYYCDNCGLGKKVHTICMNYNGINTDCETCGFSWQNHQDKYDQMMIQNCEKFVPHSEWSDRCTNCIFNNKHHMYTNRFHSLNEDAKRKICDLWFSITVNFMSMTEGDRLGFYNQYDMILKMLTNPL